MRLPSDSDSNVGSKTCHHGGSWQKCPRLMNSTQQDGHQQGHWNSNHFCLNHYWDKGYHLNWFYWRKCRVKDQVDWYRGCWSIWGSNLKWEYERGKWDETNSIQATTITAEEDDKNLIFQVNQTSLCKGVYPFHIKVPVYAHSNQARIEQTVKKAWHKSSINTIAQLRKAKKKEMLTAFVTLYGVYSELLE